MLDDLVIANLPPDSIEKMPTGQANLEWRTCLRRILFLQRSEQSLLQSRIDLYLGQSAYQFLLEVICGLHSPLLGENAVMGQFRKFRANASFPATPWGRFLSKLTTDLLVDARNIRQRHLHALGSQSYGSLIRKHLKGSQKIAVLGTGALAQEILPWLIGESDVSVLYRSALHAKAILAQHDQLKLEKFTMADVGWNGEAALVIAAPITSAELDQWIELQGVKFSPTLDLRDNAAKDPIRLSQPAITLTELFDLLRQERKKLADRTEAARKQIELLVHRRARPQQRQTFEAVCA